MKKDIFRALTLSLTSLALIMLSTAAYSEFYEYTDKNGVKCYTDDPSRIPDKTRPKARAHVERFDGLSSSKKEQKIKDERDSISEIREKKSKDSRKHEQWAAKTEYEEREAMRAEKERLREEENKKRIVEAEKSRKEREKREAEKPYVRVGRYCKN